MKHFAIGLPGEPIRMVIRAPDASNAVRQLETGEVYVEIAGITHGSIADDGQSFIAAGPDLELEQVRIRSTRTARLSASDWTQVLDARLTTNEQEAWAQYRQALRDLPADQPCLMYDDVVWPESPDSRP